MYRSCTQQPFHSLVTGCYVGEEVPTVLSLDESHIFFSFGKDDGILTGRNYSLTFKVVPHRMPLFLSFTACYPSSRNSSFFSKGKEESDLDSVFL
jgi:hypothetical protein